MRFYYISSKNKNFPYLLMIERGDNSYDDLKLDNREPYKIELYSWLIDNIGLRNKCWKSYLWGRNAVFRFNTMTDAMAFKLRWL